MLPALYDEDRRALARLATMLVAGSLCVLPLTTQSSPIAGAAGIRDFTRDTNLFPPAPLTFPAYQISRDPFEPQAAMRAKLEYAASMNSPEESSEIGVVLPANAGALQGGVPASLPETSGIGGVVRAIVLGDPPRALVEFGGAIRVLGIGDRLGALTVIGITEGRVSLSDGSALILAGERK
ncbi:MAG: hypothetical protein WBD74_10795 [Candidatus Aquilonibacter sp.]